MLPLLGPSESQFVPAWFVLRSSGFIALRSESRTMKSFRVSHYCFCSSFSRLDLVYIPHLFSRSDRRHFLWSAAQYLDRVCGVRNRSGLYRMEGMAMMAFNSSLFAASIAVVGIISAWLVGRAREAAERAKEGETIFLINAEGNRRKLQLSKNVSIIDNIAATPSSTSRRPGGLQSLGIPSSAKLWLRSRWHSNSARGYETCSTSDHVIGHSSV
jgi:hypothetical protein